MHTGLIIYLASRIRSRAHEFIIQELNQHGLKGLVPSHGAILIALYQNGSLSMKQLAQTIEKDKSTVTALVRKLIELGYIERIKSSTDRRVTHIKLTEKTLSHISDFQAISKKLTQKAYQDIAPEDQKRVVELMRQVLKNLR